jgi:undecaprenyl-diphosphatase
VHPLIAVLLGIVEGLTEFLPVSSTAHLILTSRLLGLPQTEFLKTFEIAIQLGAILAVAVLYWRKLLLDRRTLLLVLAAFIPTAIIGFALHGLVKDVLLESVPTVLWALAIGGVILIAFEWLHPSARSTNEKQMTLTQAVLIGCCQALALVPGVSRSAATIVGGQMLGVGRMMIVEFSFLLAIPTMLAATVLDVAKSRDALASADLLPLAIGFLTSFIVALLSIRWFLAFVRERSFAVFGVYRIVVAVGCWMILF